MVSIRTELSSDIDDIYTVNVLAFPEPAEAELVNNLRDANAITLSLVAVVNDQLVGHVLFSPMTITADDGTVCNAVGLAPIAVHPDFQKQGIGGQLIREGIRQLTAAGHNALILLGHPSYYPRFGFVPASQFNIRSEYDVPDEVFMAQQLNPTMPMPTGLAQYHPAFAGV